MLTTRLGETTGSQIIYRLGRRFQESRRPPNGGGTVRQCHGENYTDPRTDCSTRLKRVSFDSVGRFSAISRCGEVPARFQESNIL